MGTAVDKLERERNMIEILVAVRKTGGKTEEVIEKLLVVLEGGDIDPDNAGTEVRGIVTRWATSFLKFEGVKVTLQDGIWEWKPEGWGGLP